MPQDFLDTPQVHPAVFEVHSQGLAQLMRVYPALHPLPLGNLLDDIPQTGYFEPGVRRPAGDKQRRVIVLFLLSMYTHPYFLLSLYSRLIRSLSSQKFLFLTLPAQELPHFLDRILMVLLIEEIHD